MVASGCSFNKQTPLIAVCDAIDWQTKRFAEKKGTFGRIVFVSVRLQLMNEINSLQLCSFTVLLCFTHKMNGKHTRQSNKWLIRKMCDVWCALRANNRAQCARTRWCMKMTINNCRRFFSPVHISLSPSSCFLFFICCVNRKSKFIESKWIICATDRIQHHRNHTHTRVMHSV